MILSRPLTDAERRVSLRRLAFYNFANGLSFAGAGETVMVLVAVRLGCPDSVTAAIGTMFYAGFVMLPLGRAVAARWGAARSGGAFWAMRNVLALLVPAAAFWGTGHPAAVSATVLAGVFGFYGCRAAGVVFFGPLVGEAAGPEERGEALGRTCALFFAGMGLGCPAVLVALRGAESLGRLSAVMVAGAAFGIWSAWFLARAHETEALRAGARKPIFSDVGGLVANRAFMRHIAAASSVNLLYALVVPTSIVILRRGCGVSDLSAMAYSMVSVAAGGVASWANGGLARAIGPRRELLAAYCLLLASAAAWLLLPDAPYSSPVLLVGGRAAVFVALGVAKALNDTASIHYTIAVVEPRLVVSASSVMLMASGCIAGLAGLALTTLLMARAATGGATATPGPDAVEAYRHYFRAVLVVMLPLAAAVWRMLPLPGDAPRAK